MPFTVAHAMAVLPGVRWHERLRLDPTCLVIGSMAPDFEYFARGELVSTISHTLVGIVAWNLPATLILAALWHVLVKRPVLIVAPTGIARRVAPMIDRPWRERWTGGAYASVVISAVLGAFTHLAWDGLTHASGLAPRSIPALTTVYDVPVVGPMALHRIIQHASTVIGLAVIAIYVAAALRRQPSRAWQPHPRRRRMRLVFAACLALGVALMAYRLHRMHLVDPGSVISGTISGLLAGTLVASAVTWRQAQRQQTG